MAPHSYPAGLESENSKVMKRDQCDMFVIVLEEDFTESAFYLLQMHQI